MWARHRSNARPNVEQTAGVRLHVLVHYIEFQTRISSRILVSNNAISGGQGTRKSDCRATRAGIRRGKSGNFHKGLTKSSMKLAFLPFQTWLGPEKWEYRCGHVRFGLTFYAWGLLRSGKARSMYWAYLLTKLLFSKKEDIPKKICPRGK
jgi:hypothetical protein